MMISNDVKNILTNKMTILKDEHKNDICLVGPVTLPVQLDDEVVTFQWYTWLPLKGIPSEKEKCTRIFSNIRSGRTSTIIRVSVWRFCQCRRSVY